MEGRFRAAAQHLGDRPGRHRGGGAALRLAAPFGAREGGVFVDQLPDEPRPCEGEELAFPGNVLDLRHRQHTGGEDPAAPGGRAGDNPAHRGVGFRGREGVGGGEGGDFPEE